MVFHGFKPANRAPRNKPHDCNAVCSTHDCGNCSCCSVTAPKFVAFALMLPVLVAAGCGVFDESDDTVPAPSSTEQPRPEPEAPEAEGISAAIGYLEAGKSACARKLLARLKEESPDSPVVARLIRQIDAPIEDLLPGPYRQIKVSTGQSLYQIAGRELGDPLLFYALARLNGIEVPALVPVGSILRIPESRSKGELDPNLKTGGRARSPSTAASEVESVARHLALSGLKDQARYILIDQLDARAKMPGSTHEVLVDITRDQAQALSTEGKYEVAISIIDEAGEVVDVRQQRACLAQTRRLVESQMALAEALEMRDRGDLVPAYEMAERASDLDPSSIEAPRLLEDLSSELVDVLHGKALVAWRERDVDLAIRTWESLLAVLPGFEPAQVYLERARRLRERLDQP